MNHELCIKSEEVLADVRSAAWLEQELHPELDIHRRHQMADICEEENTEHVWRVLGNGFAELHMALLRLLKPPTAFSSTNDMESPDCWNFTFIYRLPDATVLYIKEKIHEYLVAKVMADRTAVIIPSCTDVWRIRAQDALASLRETAATAATAFAPVRRPIWPL